MKNTIPELHCTMSVDKIGARRLGFCRDILFTRLIFHAKNLVFLACVLHGTAFAANDINNLVDELNCQSNITAQNRSYVIFCCNIKPRFEFNGSEGRSKVKLDDSIANLARLDTLPRRLPATTTLSTSEVLTEKATNLQYDSDNPDDAPWKKEQFSEDDLKDLGLESQKKALPSVNLQKVDDYKDQVQDLKPSSITEEKIRDEVAKTPKPEKIEKARHVADSLMAVKDRIEMTSLEEELAGAKRVYSEKYIRKMYDSLGLTKADSMFRIASTLAKKELPKEELLERINTPIKEKTSMDGVTFDEEQQSLKVSDADKLNGLPEQFTSMKDAELSDLSSVQLPDDVLSELAPLTGQLIDSKYMPVVDSMREVVMKAKGYALDEEQLTEEVKRTVYKKKPTFLEKSYFEGILGFVNDSTISIVQFSPAWAYHFTPRLSAGLGPNISIQYSEKKINGVFGFRSFVKSEFWKQRVYLQFEDNFTPNKINAEAMRSATAHSLLFGGGGLLPLSKKLGINVAIFYRVNQAQVRPGGSPWVFRIGLSSIKNINKN